MPRLPKKENSNKPLRRLRRQLGLTQPELSDLTGIPIDTIRSLENGRIESMTPDLLRKIKVKTGGSWDRKTRHWVIGIKEPVPLTLELSERYFQLLEIEPDKELQKEDLYSIEHRIKKLFERVPKSSWVKLALRFNDYLEQCRQDFAPNDRELKGEFGRTQMRSVFYGEGEKLLGARRMYPPEMLAQMTGNQPPPPFDFKPIQHVFK
jgi:transcriptional regulator with XRE-family HTH domain